MKKFEYKIEKIGTTSGMMKLKFDFVQMESMLTGYGLKGWELVNAEKYTSPSGQEFFILFLKREAGES